MKSLVERYEEEGLIGSYFPNYVREIQLNIPSWGAVSIKVDLQGSLSSNASADLFIGFKHIEIKGEFLISDSPEIIVEKIMNSRRKEVEEAIHFYREYQSSFGENPAWVNANFPWTDGEIEIKGECRNKREICIAVYKNSSYVTGIGCIYKAAEAALCLNAFKGRRIVKKLSDFDADNASKVDLVNPGVSKHIAWVFQKGKPKQYAFVEKF